MIQLFTFCQYVFQIKYHEKTIFSQVNTIAKYHRDVKFYWGGANGWMRDLKMSSFAGENFMHQGPLKFEGFVGEALSCRNRLYA